MKETHEILYDIANNERKIEINRMDKIETKAQRYITFAIVFLSFNSTYFLFYFGNYTNNNVLITLKMIFFISCILFAGSIFLLLLSMKLYNDLTFDMVNLINISRNDSQKVALMKITGNIVTFLNHKRGVNNRKVFILTWGIRLFFAFIVSLLTGLLISIILL
ncbi:MAG: hypothetical protein ACTSVV_00185 [Promethearchaeota archaeon]